MVEIYHFNTFSHDFELNMNALQKIKRVEINFSTGIGRAYCFDHQWHPAVKAHMQGDWKTDYFFILSKNGQKLHYFLKVIGKRAGVHECKLLKNYSGKHVENLPETPENPPK